MEKYSLSPLITDDSFFLKCIKDNITFYALKKNTLDLLFGMTGDCDAYEDINEKYLWGFEIAINTLRTEDELADYRADEIFDMLSNIFYKHVNNFSFREIMIMDTSSLAEVIFNEWIVSLKAYRIACSTNKKKYHD